MLLERLYHIVIVGVSFEVADKDAAAPSRSVAITLVGNFHRLAFPLEFIADFFESCNTILFSFILHKSKLLLFSMFQRHLINLEDLTVFRKFLANLLICEFFGDIKET